MSIFKCLIIDVNTVCIGFYTFLNEVCNISHNYHLLTERLNMGTLNIQVKLDVRVYLYFKFIYY